MIKDLNLGLVFAGIVCVVAALACGVPLATDRLPQPPSDHHSHHHHHHHHNHNHDHHSQQHHLQQQQHQANASASANRQHSAALSDDGTVRSERSTNLSHITGSARKIRMYVKNRHLQVLPDGTVNGTSDDTSDYTVLQRTTVNIGQLKIQGVATCQYLCMDSCGLLYGSKEFLDECIFNEMIEQSHYNTYSSARYSNNRRTMYLALNRRGQPRKVQIRAQQQLGKLSTYTRVLTQPVSPERVEELINRLTAAHHSHSENGTTHPLRHHGSATGHLCASATVSQAVKHQPMDQPGVDRLRCRRRKKRKKKRKNCNEDRDGICPNKPFALPKQKCAANVNGTNDPSCAQNKPSKPNKKNKCSSSEEDDGSCIDKPTKLPPKKKCSSDEDDGSCSDKINNKPLNPKKKCSPGDTDGPCSNKPSKPQSKRKCSPDGEDSACGDRQNKTRRICSNEDGPCISDKSNINVSNSKRKCSPEDGACGESSKKMCVKGEDGSCSPKKNATRCDNKDECQRIPNNKLVNKKNNKKNRFVQNAQSRLINKKQKNTKSKTFVNKNKKVLQNRDVELTTSSSGSSSSSSSGSTRWETTTPYSPEAESEPSTIAFNVTLDMEAMSSTTEGQDVFTSEEDYSSKAISSASDETESAQASSWEDPFIPPYPDPTSEATPI